MSMGVGQTQSAFFIHYNKVYGFQTIKKVHRNPNKL